MSESCYTTLCGHGEIAPEYQNAMTREFCSVFQDMVCEVGAASLLEASPCPLTALTELTVQPTDSPSQAARRTEIANKLSTFGLGSIGS